MNKKSTNPMVSNRQKKKRLVMRTFAMLFFMALFTQIAQAQVYMHSGTQTVPGTGSLYFYDSGGPSSPDFWWEKWYSHNENATLTFKNGDSPILVTFNQFTAYDGNTGANIGQFALRVNDDHLYVYEGDKVDNNKLIVELTGTIEKSFSIMANGPITFKFVSNASYRDEGWAASVSTADTYTVQQPVMMKETCDDVVVLLPTAPNATLYYTTDGSNPTTSSTEYTTPFAIDLDAETASVTVKAIAVVDTYTSATASNTFTHADQRPTPGVPTISIDGNMVHITPAAVPLGLNETYNVRYTTDGSEPSANNGTLITAPWNPIEWHTPNTTFKAVTVAVSCPDKVSSVVSVNFGNVTVPTPVITFNTDGTATIACSLTGASIFYTLDGSTPTTSSGDFGTTSVTTAALTPGTTVKAIAHYGSPGYVDSDMASNTYVPEGGSTVGGGIVLLDDREDHSWSYYSDATSPVKSLNPADVKITYFGNGKMYTSTTATPSGNLSDATGVQVSATETEHTFIYLKTLERANGEAGTGNLAYTLIPNPFSVRPKFTSSGTTYYTGFYGWRVKRLNGVTINGGYAVGSIIPAETEIQFVTNNSEGNEVDFEAVWARAFVTTTTSTTGLSSSVGYERNFMVLSTSPSSQSQSVTLGSGNSTTNGRNVPLYINRGNGYGYSLSQQIYTASEIGSSGSITSLAFRVSNAQSSNRTLHIYMISTTKTDFDYSSDWSAYESETVYNSDLVFSGTVNFNQTGWKTITLDTPFEYDGSSNIIVTVFDATGTYMRTSPQFYTYSGNAVYNSRTSAFNENGYYFAMNHSDNKPQMQFTVLSPAGNDVSNITVPCTVMGCNPDGSNQTSATLAGNISCGADLKIEHINVNGSTSNIINGNGHTLVIGRGITNGSDNVASAVYGDYNPSATANNFTLRVESGRYTNIRLLAASSATQITSTFTGNMIVGSDYDRAKGINTNLIASGAVEVANRVMCSEADAKLNVTALSGTFGSDADDVEFYMGYVNLGTTNSKAPRNLEVLGGEFLGGIAGGIEYGVGATTDVLRMRFKGGTIHRYVYGSGQYASAYGVRKTIVTGGTFDAWIAGGCYGTDNTNNHTGTTNGDAYIYFGGKAKQTSTGGIFGAGYGNFATIDGYYTINKSFVVVADDATIAGNVYGGGNNGYNTSDAYVYVLGGGEKKLSVAGSVFGGANMAKSEATTNVTMKEGTVTGSLYGGANASGEVAGLATVSVSGGKVSNVFGGGYGSGTNMAAGTAVNISGGTINNNVYGGSDAGTVTGNTNVTVSGGTMKDVYGAGKGGSTTALVSGQTNVTVSGGTISGDVFGGGQNGNVVFDDGGSGSSSGTEIYSENFDSMSSISTTYSATNMFAYNAGSGNNWTLYSTYPYSGSYCAGVKYDYTNAANCYLVSAPFTVDANMTNLSVSLYERVYSSSYAETFEVFFVKASDVTNAASVVSATHYSAIASTSYTNTTYAQVSGSNSNSALAGQSVRVVVHCTSPANRYYLYIDDISVSVESPSSTPTEVVPASFVKVSGGAISGSVFGGGKMGTTTGAVTTTVSGGNIRGNVFGGAEGEQKKVFVTGMRTVNMTGGHVYGNVYGGSRNANDGNDLDLQDSAFSGSTETGTICVTNISGGIIDQNVYAAGYYGNTFGSVYAFIGKNAIENAPYKQPTTGINYKVSTLYIHGTVWAGGDWGTFSGSFGGSTVSGNSNIYVDGTDYETTTTQTSNAQYMNIGGSILGCGTSCDAGKNERTIIIRNYGTAIASGSKAEPFTKASRDLMSIQRAKILILDNASINYNGQGKINSLSATEKYAIYEIANTGSTLNTEDLKYGVRLVNGSSLFLNAPVSQISNFISASCTNVYTAALTTDYPALAPDDLNTTDNKVRVNGGNYVEVKYGTQYCMLSGYAHMMVSTSETDATCAYARPRWITGASFAINNTSYDNRNDGGWVSYTGTKNKVALDGTNPGDPGVQMVYENHTQTKNGEDYYRIWRDGGNEHYREGVFDAQASGDDKFKTVDVTITLPALRDKNYVYRFETIGDGTNTSINYGPDVMTFDAARATGSGDDWISYTTSQSSGQTQAAVQTLLNNGILVNPDVNFGLIVMPNAGAGLTGGTYLISQNADNNLALATTQFTNADFTKDNDITFRLTYYDKLSSNMTWEPMTIVLVQVDPTNPSVILDRVTISLAVNTSTTITQEFHTTLYAVMQGKGSNADTYTAKVTLPTFSVVPGQESTFTVNSVTFEPNVINASETGKLIQRGGTYTRTDFSVTYGAGNNYDNTNGWSSTTGQNHDAYTTNNNVLGTTGGRNEFAIDFSLHYNGHESISTVDTLGVLTYNITFNNFVNDLGTTVNNQPLTIKVYVIRRGQGTKFYLDGINGSNTYDGKHPDQAALSLSTIFNRLGYLAGDEIYIVNEVTIDKQTTWNGSAYDNVLIYRYDGGHELATAAGIIGNAENNAYLGTLLNVKHNLVMTGITLDGHYNDGSNQIQVGVDDSNNPVYAPFTPVTAESPMIFIDELAKVELNSGAVLRQNNNNTGNGGAVSVADGGTLMMNADAQITHNVTAGNGGGVYMAGTLNVSDNIQIYDNKKGTAQNNVYLDGADKVVTLGTESSTDAYGALSSSAKIGVTKTTSEEYTKVVHVESESDVAWLDTPYDMHPNTVIFHDANVYQLERYNDPTYLYWVGTWVTTVTWNPYFESREAAGYTNDMTAAQLKDIHTPQQLAWVISMVNGENGCTAQGNLTVNLTADIDMDASIWVPIGTEAHPFTGTFDGQGFMVEGIHSSLVHTNMGTFGTTSGTIQNAMFNVALNANATNMGTVAGTMTGGTISNIEAAGTLTGGSLTQNMGGLVGLTQTGSEVHSSFSINTMTGVATTVMGGLVGTNGGDLINSYANTSMSTSDHLGGLAGDNTGRIENCYVVAGTGTFPLFAYNNTGTITYCYADKTGNFVTPGQTEPTKSGQYGTVLGYKDYGYMYDDNKVTASGNEYVLAEHAYDANHIVKWDGLLSVLNQWVSAHSGYTSWFRPITQNINGDLPVLGFPKNNSLATLNSDKKFLEYSTNLDQLLEDYSGQTASIFLYGNAANVTKTPGTNTVVYINENAALIQAGSSDFKAVVGVTFDNNYRKATTWNEIIGLQTLTYDWHFLSSPLQAAPLGISYTDEDQHNWWETEDDTQVDQVVGSYFPDHIELAKKADGTTPVGWDIYSFFEPQYHWINLKRNSASHFHYDMNDENIHENIVYTNETTFEPGKGYMMAVETDSYLANSGMLNNKDFTVNLTYQSPEEDEKGCNFLGNPYHAYFNLDAFFNNTTNAGNGISSAWVYIAESDDYVPYAKGASSNPLLPSGALHPFQGFFVKVTGDCTAAFTKSMATTEQDNSYFRGSHENYPLVNLFAYNEAGQRDFVVVEFNRPEKGGATKMTAQRRAPFTLTAQDGQDEYTILFNDQNTKRVPIRFATTEDGTYTMQWETYHGTFNKLLLIDNITGTTCDMTTNDHYTFEGRATDFANRFYLVVNATDVDEFDADGDYNNFAYFNGSEWIVNGQGQLDLIDMTGRVLHSEYLAGESNRVSFGNVAAGVYVIRFGNKAQKIVIK